MLNTDENTKFPSQWSPDGKFILYSDNNPGTRLDLWVVPLEGDRKPRVFLKTEFDEAQGQLSPDGRWMAYMTAKTNQREVYVAAFPSGEGERRISIAGGEQPRWRQVDGKELFYVAADGKMMAVSIRTAPGPKAEFQHDPPAALFDSQIAVAADTRAFQYDVSRDGKRFLVTSSESASTTSTLPPLTVVVNWADKK